MKPLYLLTVLVLALGIMGCVGSTPDKMAKEAVQTQNISSCSKTGDFAWNDWCYYEIAKIQNNPIICQQIKNKTVVELCFQAAQINAVDLGASGKWVNSMTLTLKKVYFNGAYWCIDLDARNNGSSETDTPFNDECWVVDSAGYTVYEAASTNIHTRLLPTQKVMLTGCYSISPDRLPLSFVCAATHTTSTYRLTCGNERGDTYDSISEAEVLLDKEK
jgi:hypothetical protein